MQKSTLLFIQGGGKGAYEADKKLSLFLEEKLKDKCLVIHPQIHDEYSPDYKNYKAVIDGELNKVSSKIILVGHSVGSCFLLKYLSEEKINKDVRGVFLIATPFWGDGGWQYEGFSLLSDFAFRLPGIPIYFYHSTNDEIVPFSHLALYEKKLPFAVFRKIEGRGHQFNNDLSEVVQDIQSLSKLYN